MTKVIGLVGWPGSIQNIVISIFKKKKLKQHVLDLF